MDELSKIRRVLQKHDETAPHYSLLVVDGSLGSNSIIEQARVFHEKFGLDGLIVTKLDGTSRGGSLVGIYRELQLLFIFWDSGSSPMIYSRIRSIITWMRYLELMAIPSPDAYLSFRIKKCPAI